MPVINLPDALRERLGAEGAQALVELLNRTGRDTRDEVVFLAEERFGRRLAEAEARFDRKLAEVETRLERRLGEEIGKVRQDLAGLETRVFQGQADLETRVSQGKAELIKWMFLFWAGQIAILFAFFK